MLKKLMFAGVVAMSLLPGQSSAEDAPRVTVADYQRAEQMLNKNIAAKLLNASIDPIWLPDGDHFWYRHQSAAGWDFVAVDPQTGNKSSAFDHTLLAASLSKLLGMPIDGKHLALDDLTFADPKAARISFHAGGHDVACVLATAACDAKPTVREDSLSATSPDGRFTVFARNDNLWLKGAKSAKPRQLTKDGEPHFSYGKMPDAALLRVLSQTKGFALPLYGVDWSPDSRHIVVTRVDERRVPDYYFLQLAPYNGDRRPKPVTVRSALSGETDLGASEVSVIDVASGAARKLAVGAGGLSGTHYWDPTGSRFMVMQGGDYSRKETLYEVTVVTGVARAVLSEESKTFLQISPLEYDEQALRFLPASNEMIWFSQRDGWNHLYLVDIATGAIKAKITQGDWDVQNILRVDTKARRIYFTGAGRVPGENPYWRHLYSANFDGTDLKLLTPEPADHVFPGAVNAELAQLLKGIVPLTSPILLSPSGRYLIDTYSTVESAPVSVLKRCDGSAIATLETADASAAFAAGYTPPKAFTAKAADGKTDLYGFLVLPANFNPDRKYPVVDAIYNGPQVVTTPHNFAGAMSALFMGDAHAFAQLGFVVVVMDGRGTPMRSKAFQDYIYNNMQEFGLEDHVVAIKELAATRPYMDIDRVGLYGHSFGGYTTMKGILGYPDFFKVAAASAGPYDLYGMYSLDAFFAPPIYKNGATRPAGPGDRPTNWGAINLTQQAGRLKGKLMLAFADLDENAYPAVSARMVNALIAANKSFDLVYMPNRSHSFDDEPYFIRRRWDFFVRNLLGAEPPKDYEMSTFK